MAKYRAIYYKIWTDPDFQLYSPEAKLIFIYLITNSTTTESGIYDITHKTISDATNIPLQTVVELFNNGLKNVMYDIENHCIFVKRFRRYNAGGNPEFIHLSIKNDIRLNPKTKLWLEFVKEYPEYQCDYDEIVEQLANGSRSVSAKGSGSSSGISKGNGNSKGSGNTEQQPKDDYEREVFNLYESNWGMINSPIIVEELKDITKTYEKGWFKDAIKEGFSSQKDGRKPSLKYVVAILERWVKEGKGDGKKTEGRYPYKYVN